MEHSTAPSSTFGSRFWDFVGSSATTLGSTAATSAVRMTTARPSVTTTLTSSASREPSDVPMDVQLRSQSALRSELRTARTLLTALKDLDASPSLREYLMASSRTLRAVGSSEPAAITAALAWALYVYLQSENSYAHWVAAARAFSRPGETVPVPDRFRLTARNASEPHAVDAGVLRTASAVRSWLGQP